MGKPTAYEENAVYVPQEVAHILRTNREQVYAWIRTGELPAFHLYRNAQKWLVHGRDITSFVHARKADENAG